MRVSMPGRSWLRISYERIPGHRGYFDWAWNPACSDVCILEIGRVWISWERTARWERG